MPESSHAVFLSYASADAEVARRLTEALRAEGIEVWFDESELRGGDVWDAKIRRQISGCALFVPIISAHSQDRREGYFRLEWRLADERSRLMAEGTPFVLPVVADGVKERDALVPKSFLDVQWTSLPHGDVPTAFVVRVQRLLANASTSERFTVPGVGDPGPASTRPATKVHRRVPAAAWVVGGVVVLGGLLMFLWPRRPETGAGTRPVTAERQTVDAKSIAVLPFANMSEDAAANAFFADGMHEDVITNLALVRELRVVSRTTALQYRDSKVPLRAIGAELGVAYILEGSVRRAGTKVRVTGQLINARTDEHVWAKSYDRDLSDVFAIQAELAREIAAALRAAVSPQEQRLMESRFTQNPGAYDLFLKAREIRHRGVISAEAQRDQATLLQAAVMLDPEFALAWAELAFAHALEILNNFDNSAANVAAATNAIARAVHFAPEAPPVRRAQADILYLVHRDYARALAGYEELARSWPLDASAHYGIANIHRRRGQWAEAEREYRAAQRLDPGMQNPTRQLLNLYRSCRRYDDAIAEQQRIVAQNPGDCHERYTLAALSFLATGSVREVESLLVAQPEAVPRAAWNRLTGDLVEAAKLDRERSDRGGGVVDVAVTLLALGQLDAASASVEEALPEVRARTILDPENPSHWTELARLEALAGRREAALAAAQRAITLVPESLDAFSGHRYRATLAFVHAWTGDVDGALAEFAHVLQESPSGSSWCTVHGLRRGPWAWPLRDDPRWQALLADPKSNAPLL